MLCIGISATKYFSLSPFSSNITFGMNFTTPLQHRFWNRDVPNASISASCSHDMNISQLSLIGQVTATNITLSSLDFLRVNCIPGRTGTLSRLDKWNMRLQLHAKRQQHDSKQTEPELAAINRYCYDVISSLEIPSLSWFIDHHCLIKCTICPLFSTKDVSPWRKEKHKFARITVHQKCCEVISSRTPAP